VLFVALTLPVGRPNRDPEWLEARRYGTRRMMSDAALNVALFVPLGWAVHRAARAPRATARAMLAATLVSAGLSLGLETLQYLLTYRFSSVFDVAANVAGGVGGALLDRIAGRG
jgi:glycopeptide antibiotics resistance protein